MLSKLRIIFQLNKLFDAIFLNAARLFLSNWFNYLIYRCLNDIENLFYESAEISFKMLIFAPSKISVFYDKQSSSPY